MHAGIIFGRLWAQMDVYWTSSCNSAPLRRCRAVLAAGVFSLLCLFRSHPQAYLNSFKAESSCELEALGRLVPQLPDFVFGDSDILPQDLGAGLSDISVQIYRRQRLLRALRHLLRERILHPARSIPPAITSTEDRRRVQYRGEFSCITWNAQVLFAAEDY